MDETNDRLKFIQSDSDGVTRIGQLFLQKAAEAYVYCILGAQAQTRWRIVGAGAKSLQTQEIFNQLVNDVVAQDDDTVIITDMRTAVKAMNVVLNLAIMPGLILVPSDLLILKDKIPGYNNLITMATKKMNFGLNSGLNYDAESVVEPVAEPVAEPVVEPVVKPVVEPVATSQDVNEELGVIFKSLLVIGAVVARILM